MIRRHSLVWLRDLPPESLSHDVAGAWREAGNPFIVCRRRPDEDLSLGFCLPGSAGGAPLRMGCSARLGEVVETARPPLLREVARKLPGEWSERIECFIEGFQVRLVGSRMWDILLGGGYVRPESDIDVIVDVADSAEADAAVEALRQLEVSLPCRLDGEISLAGVGEIHWREWTMDEVMVKSVEGIRLVPRAAL